MVTIRDQTAGPPTAGPSGRNHNTASTLDPDPTQDPSGHLGPAVPSAGLKPLPAQEESNAAAYDKMVAIRDRMAEPPTAGPSGQNHQTPSTPDPDPTQDPSGRLGPTAPSGKTHPKPRHNQPDNLNGSPVSLGHLGSSAPSGKSHSTQDPHRPPPSLVMQWNINGFWNNFPDLELLVHEQQPLVIALQEIHRIDEGAMNNTLGRHSKPQLPPFTTRWPSGFPPKSRPPGCQQQRFTDPQRRLTNFYTGHHRIGDRHCPRLHEDRPPVAVAHCRDPHGSDHTPIVIALSDKNPPETTRRPRWKYENADWAAFQAAVEDEFENAKPCSMEEITSAIVQAAGQAIPKTSPNPGKRALHWAKDRLPPDHPGLEQANEDYKAARNSCRQEIREAKERSWKEFLDSINDQQTSAELWQKVNSLQGKRRTKGSCLNVNGSPTRDPQEISEALAEYFHGLSAIDKYPAAFLKAHPSPRTAVSSFAVPPDRDQEFNLPFKPHVLDFALSRAKGKSSGCKWSLLQAINTMSLVVPIPKGSGPANQVSSYRPIALTSCASKIVEKMVNRRLVEHLETNGYLDHRQHAFRAGRGTGSSLAESGQTLDDALENNEHAEIISLDLAKAYNRAWTPDVLASVREEETGVPQGSVIAVTIFLVAMHGVFETIPRGVYLKVYADDITLIVIGVHPKALRKKAQAATNAVGKWAAKAGFDISATKSARLHICGSNHQLSRKHITLNKEVIPTRRTLKTLGVTLDRHLTLQAHFENVKKSCETRLNFLRSISGRRTRSNRATHLRVADAVIWSRLTYGIEITCRARDRLIKVLGPIHNLAIRTISGLLPSNPADAACVEADPENGQGCFLRGQANLALQSVANATLPPVAGLHRLGPRSWSARAPEIDRAIKNRFARQAQPQELQAFFLERIRGRYSEYVIHYTDGSKLGNRVGIGVHGHKSTKGLCRTGSYSNSAISAIENAKSKHPFIQDTQAALDAAEHRTVLMWVPGHCGIHGNERADVLAGIGRNSPFLTRKIPADNAKKWIKDTIRQAWSNEWRRNRTLFLRKAKPTTEPGEDLPNRRDQIVLSRFRTGHTRASHNMAASNSGFRRQCENCDTPNTVKHFLCVCPALGFLRETHQIYDIPSSLSNDQVRERQVINFLKEGVLYHEI
ncbi:uncharacterized protein LOC134286654 [Aedes albopictus]|uniref:Reverse transcriptase domain-containing protein n=1 Tax=Aedes albopictus TaxID=7160 RepID=A0ABM1YKP8_AEDAL